MSWEDPLAYPGTANAVLQNKFAERDPTVLRNLEYAAANARLIELAANPIPGKFDLDHLKAIHAYLLQDVYEWAGKTREEIYKDYGIVNFAKAGVNFVPQDEIASTSKFLFNHLQNENHLKGLTADVFASRLTEYYAGLNKIHHFREGNGRTTQALLWQLANEAGYSLNYNRVTPERWNEAAKQSARGDLTQMKSVFSEITSPALSLVQSPALDPIAQRAKETLAQAAKLKPMVASAQQQTYQSEKSSQPKAENKKGYTR